MTIVKKVINNIAKPLTHICNLSFQSGRFANKMKIAKVIPLYKNESKHSYTITDQYHYYRNSPKS